MALTQRSLSGAITATQTQVTLDSSTGVVRGSILRVDNEKMEVQDISLAPMYLVDRGVGGTAAVAHDTLAPVAAGLASDFPAPDAPSLYSYGQDGAVEIKDGQHFITKATAAALTLAVPSIAKVGTRMVITSLTNAAHVITAAGAIIGDGTAGLNTTLTWAAQAGASITLVVAPNGLYMTNGIVAVTPAP